ncbi:hypothetical protein, partial [Escherichia coli]|uniref:hypothetical protein n=1 Tax=Escherichia coli TaxID=562 RepID=UPI001F48A51E
MILNCSALRYAGGYLSSLMTALMITVKKRYLHRMVNMLVTRNTALLKRIASRLTVNFCFQEQVKLKCQWLWCFQLWLFITPYCSWLSPIRLKESLMPRNTQDKFLL